jgi:hypothetical protein
VAYGPVAADLISVAFVKEDFRIFASPSRAALPIFTDNYSKPHAGATVAVLAVLAQTQHAITQVVAHDPSSWRRWRSNLDRGRSRRRAIVRRNHDPRPVATLLITSTLVVTVAARPRLALRSNGGASGPANDRADCSPAPAVQCSTYDCPGSTAEDCAAHRVLCGRIMRRRRYGNG